MAERAGLTGDDALDNAARLGYQHRITYLVDPKTGKGTAVKFDGRKIEESNG